MPLAARAERVVGQGDGQEGLQSIPVRNNNVGMELLAGKVTPGVPKVASLGIRKGYRSPWIGRVESKDRRKGFAKNQQTTK